MHQLIRNSLQTEWRSIGLIHPYPGNPMTHPAEQIEQIAASIKAFGFIKPILVDEAGEIVAGEAAWLAAKSLGMDLVLVLPIEHLSPTERRLFRMADNRIPRNGVWSEELLAKELAAVSADSGQVIDLDKLLGFTKKEIERLLKGAHAGPAGHTEPNAAPPAPEVPVSRLGDTWSLGGHHRLRCGSSTSAHDVAALLAGEKPHIMVTDPPYGVNYDPSWRQAAGLASSGAATGKVLNDDIADWTEAWRLFPGHVAYVWHGGLHSATVQASLGAAGFIVRAQVIWNKKRMAIGRGAYHWKHEPAFYAVKPGVDDCWQNERFDEDHEVASYAVKDGETSKWVGGRKQSTVWDIEHIKNDTGHGTQKPVECMRRPIVNNSRIGEAIYEPFDGSGSTIIAAHVAGRRALAMELSPAYVDVAVRRWQEFTKGVALLDGTTSTFAEIAAERAKQLEAA